MYRNMYSCDLFLSCYFYFIKVVQLCGNAGCLVIDLVKSRFLFYFLKIKRVKSK